MRGAILAIVLCAIPAGSSFRATDDEMRVVNVVVDAYVEEARDFWDLVQRKNTETLRGKDAHPTLLAMSLTAIAPLPAMGVRHDYAFLPEEKAFNAMRTGGKSAVYAHYAKMRPGPVLEWLRRRRDLLIVREPLVVDPEKFYARHPKARGLLHLSTPAVVGDEALVYAHLWMVYSEEGRVFYLRKERGRWRIAWQLTLYDVPGC